MGWKGKAGEGVLSYHFPSLFAQFMRAALPPPLCPQLTPLFLVAIEQVGKCTVPIPSKHTKIADPVW